MRVRWLAAIVVLVLASSIAHAQDSVWDAMRAPGAIVVVRHSFAPGSFDPPNARLDDCSTQRNLDDNGRARPSASAKRFDRTA